MQTKNLALWSLMAALLHGLPPAIAAESEDPNWPCIQRKVSELSPGMVWAGPPVEELEEDWGANTEVMSLARQIAARSLAIEEAVMLIAAYATDLRDHRNQKLTALFAATLAIVNSDRNSIISGIERYARRQKRLAERIQRQTSELNRQSEHGSAEEEERRRELEERQTWDMRIFEERERSLSYICQQPVILEQRLFALSREIMAYLD